MDTCYFIVIFRKVLNYSNIKYNNIYVKKNQSNVQSYIGVIIIIKYIAYTVCTAQSDIEL